MRTLRLLTGGKVIVQGMIEGKYQLKDGLIAFSQVDRPEVGKILLSRLLQSALLLG